MPGWEIVVFIATAAVAAGTAMGGVTLAYFLDKWRVDPAPHQRPATAHEEPPGSPYDQAA